VEYGSGGSGTEISRKNSETSLNMTMGTVKSLVTSKSKKKKKTKGIDSTIDRTISVVNDEELK